MKKNLPLIIGIVLPIIFIVLISVVVLLPNKFIDPQYNFIYQDVDRYSNFYQNNYSVSNGKIVSVANPRLTPEIIKDPYLPTHPPLYFYDVEKEISTEITFEEALKYDLSGGSISPDGYTIETSYNNNGIFDIFGSNNSGVMFVMVDKNGAKKKINGIKNQNYYQEINIIGWIK